MNDESTPYPYSYPGALVTWYDKMAEAAATLSPQQRKELTQWEADSIDGHSFGLSDWPGWEALIGPRPRPELFDLQQSPSSPRPRFGASSAAADDQV